jgi:hypothetical protein
MQSCDDWGPESKEKYGRLWFERSAQYCIIQMLTYTPKSPFFYNRRAAEDVGSFLGAFAKLQKATRVFVMSVCLSIRPHGTRVPLEGLSSTLTTTTGILHEDLYTFMIISRWILLKMRNVPHKSCRESQNTHFMFNNFFPESRAVYEILWKNI